MAARDILDGIRARRSNRVRRHHGEPDEPTGRFWVAIVAIGLVVGIVAANGLAVPYLILLGVAGLLAPFTRRWLERYGRLSLAQAYAIASTYMVLFSTLVIRKRTTSALAENPLDSAGLFRVAALGIAGLLAGLSILLTRDRPAGRLPLFSLLFGAYIVAASLAIPLAVDKGLVVFRVFALTAFFAVFVAVFRSFEGRMSIPVRHLMFFVWALMASSIVSVILWPSETTHRYIGPPRLTSLYPIIDSDFLGVLGTLSVAYGLGGRRIRWAPVLAGVGIIVAAQHRTGLLVVLVLVLLRLLVSRRPIRVALALFMAAMVLAVVATGIVGSTWNRGQDQSSVGTLSNRTAWWDAGFNALGRSPISGLGLSSGVRYEVFPSLSGYGYNAVPNLHSTYIEVLVGTGILGLTCFLAALATALARGWKVAWRGDQLLPLLLLAAVAVNGTTLSTFELGSLLTVVFFFAGAAAFDDEFGPWPRHRRVRLAARPPTQTVANPIETSLG